MSTQRNNHFIKGIGSFKIILIFLIVFCGNITKSYSETVDITVDITTDSQSEYANENNFYVQKNRKNIIELLNELTFTSVASKKYEDELNHLDIYKQYQQFCKNEHIVNNNKYPLAKKYFQKALLCDDDSAKKYNLEETQRSEWIANIHFTKIQGSLPIINKDLACVIKKIYINHQGPAYFCTTPDSDEGFKIFLNFSDQTGLKLQYLINVLKILENIERHQERLDLLHNQFRKRSK